MYPNPLPANRISDAANLTRLVAAVVLQAVRDAQKADTNLRLEARDWLANEAHLYLDVLGISPDVVLDWLEETENAKTEKHIRN